MANYDDVNFENPVYDDDPNDIEEYYDPDGDLSMGQTQAEVYDYNPEKEYPQLSGPEKRMQIFEMRDHKYGSIKDELTRELLKNHIIYKDGAYYYKSEGKYLQMTYKNTKEGFYKRGDFKSIETLKKSKFYLAEEFLAHFERGPQFAKVADTPEGVQK